MKKLWILCLVLMVLVGLVGCSKTVDNEPDVPTTPEEAVEQAQLDASEAAVAYTEFTSVDDLKASLPDVEILAKDELDVLPLIETDEEFKLAANYITKFNDNSLADVYYFPVNPGEEFYVVTLRQSVSGFLNPSQDVHNFSGDFNDYPLTSELRLMNEGVVVDLYGYEEGILLADWVNAPMKTRYCLCFSTPVPAAVVESIIRALYS